MNRIKLYIFLLTVLTMQISIINAQKENDFHFPRIAVVDGIEITSNWMNNLMIYHKYDELNELSTNAGYNDKLSKEEKHSFKNKTYYLNPYCDLFYSRFSRFKYVIRKIDTDKEENYGFRKGERKILRFMNDTGMVYLKDTIFKKELSFLSLIKDGLNKGALTLYEKNKEVNDFRNQSSLIKFVDSNFNQIRFIKMKEAVYFDYTSLCLKNRIIGIGLCINNREFWMYYPELRNYVSSYYLSHYLYNYSHSNWPQILNLGGFESKIIFSSDSQDDLNYHNDFYSGNDINQGVHRNQLDPYFYLSEIIKSRVQIQTDPSSQFKLGSLMSGEEIYYDSLNDIKVIIEFKDGLSNGNYTSFYENGQKYQFGSMRNGRKDGVWESYYSSGKLMTKRTYNNGVEEGRFHIFYENGNLLMSYFYQDGKLNGEFIRNNERGKLLEKGKFKNDYVTGTWKVNYYISEQNLQYLKRFPLKSINNEEIKNSYFSYTTKLEQYNIGVDHTRIRVRLTE